MTSYVTNTSCSGYADWWVRTEGHYSRPLSKLPSNPQQPPPPTPNVHCPRREPYGSLVRGTLGINVVTGRVPTHASGRYIRLWFTPPLSWDPAPACTRRSSRRGVKPRRRLCWLLRHLAMLHRTIAICIGWGSWWEWCPSRAVGGSRLGRCMIWMSENASGSSWRRVFASGKGEELQTVVSTTSHAVKGGNERETGATRCRVFVAIERMCRSILIWPTAYQGDICYHNELSKQHQNVLFVKLPLWNLFNRTTGADSVDLWSGVPQNPWEYKYMHTIKCMHPRLGCIHVCMQPKRNNSPAEQNYYHLNVKL